MEVVGVFNPAAIRHDGAVILLLRVAEAPREQRPGVVASPVYNPDTRALDIKRWMIDDPAVDTSDPRVIVVGGRTWLTSISHLRVARSSDGITFAIDAAPAMLSADQYEAFGLEDPRITLLDGRYWINYSAVSPHGIATALASTTDFRSFDRHGIIFPPNNRDVTIFPERIRGRCMALHRPMPDAPGEVAIWLASGDHLTSWGEHRFVAGARENAWEAAKIGGGAVPFRVRVGNEDAWLAVYHGVSREPTTYSLGALLLDAHDPARVLARSREPILEPEARYEREGFFSGVVFTCGLLADGDVVRIYYGAADGVTAVADLSLGAILAGLA